jgi:DNA-binding transcriptional MocR family regulator
LIVGVFSKNFKDNPIIKWSNPDGGYFISVDVYGSAKRTVELCKKIGLILTPAGATFPLGFDLNDSNIRIAPSYPNIKSLECAIEFFCMCVKISAMERIIKKNTVK